jgi:serine/threonine-protein kinase
MNDAADEVIARAQERVGKVLRGKWRLERLLGVGGMASVYAAVHRNGMRGAVKMLHPELSTHSGARERFLREGYAANTVEHEGAVTVLDDDAAEDGSVFLVMELLDGAAIEQVAVRLGGKLTVSEVAAIGDQLLDVLEAAHEKGIWHRDLKPENLFVTRQGRVKVLDFGIAKVKQSAQSSRATSTGSVMGTPAFMPPEQALGRWSQVDGRTDLFAVGATLLNLLTGVLLHRGETAAEVLVSAATKPAPPVQTIDPSVPEPLALVLDRALKFDREERWPDAKSMQAALREACGFGDLSRLIQALEASPRSTGDKAAGGTLPSIPTQEPDTRVRPQVERAPQYTPTSVLPDPQPPAFAPAATLQEETPPPVGLMTASPVSYNSDQLRRPRSGLAIVVAATVMLGIASVAGAIWWFGGDKGAREGAPEPVPTAAAPAPAPSDEAQPEDEDDTETEATPPTASSASATPSSTPRVGGARPPKPRPTTIASSTPQTPPEPSGKTIYRDF